MPTFLSHAAVPLALGAGLGPRAVPAPLLAAGVVASVIPDLDVVGLRLGVPYGAALGHRGLSHSLLVAVLLAAAGAVLLRRALRSSPDLPRPPPERGSRGGPRPEAAFAFLLVSAASHGLLDAVTSGGLGVALLWPLSDERFFAPFRPIRVAPLGAAGLYARGAAVLASELAWIWGPAALLAATLRLPLALRGRPARS